MHTVLNHHRLSRTPWFCGMVSVLAATVLGCGAAVSSVLALEAVWTDPSTAAEPALLVVLLAASALREKSCREERGAALEPDQRTERTEGGLG